MPKSPGHNKRALAALDDGTPKMNRFLFAAALGLAALAGPAAGEDLLQIYREAQQNDPAIAAAKYDLTIKSDTQPDLNRNFGFASATITA